MSERVRIVMAAGPEEFKDGSGIIAWYVNNGYLADFLEEFAADNMGEMAFRPETGRYEILFEPNDCWPAAVTEQAYRAASYLQNPDDDGNYLISGRPVSALIRSIDGVEFYETKAGREQLKEEFMEVL